MGHYHGQSGRTLRPHPKKNNKTLRRRRPSATEGGGLASASLIINTTVKALPYVTSGFMTFIKWVDAANRRIDDYQRVAKFKTKYLAKKDEGVPAPVAGATPTPTPTSVCTCPTAPAPPPPPPKKPAAAAK